MIEAITDMIRSVLAMWLSNIRLDIAEKLNQQARRKYMNCAEDILNTVML